MGSKISIDSATLMNKGLEVIEARWLFNIGFDRIKVVVHPQSIVHSMVVYEDGAVIAQMGVPDMKGAIAYGLSHPRRLAAGCTGTRLCPHRRADFRRSRPGAVSLPGIGLSCR
jgi:1-deoxy-D-xylulose 5-phosphate reductoisomerase